MLRIHAVRKAFGDHVVLDGIDLDVAAGEVVCLIGASGSPGSGGGYATDSGSLTLRNCIVYGSITFSDAGSPTLYATLLGDVFTGNP